VKLKITVHGVAYEVDVEVLDPGEGFLAPGALPEPSAVPTGVAPGGSARSAPPMPAAPKATRAPAPADGTGASSLIASPVPGTVLELRCKAGDRVGAGTVLLVIDAMKMNTSITAPATGTVKRVVVAAGDTVREGQTLVELE